MDSTNRDEIRRLIRQYIRYCPNDTENDRKSIEVAHMILNDDDYLVGILLLLGYVSSKFPELIERYSRTIAIMMVIPDDGK